MSSARVALAKVVVFACSPSIPGSARSREPDRFGHGNARAARSVSPSPVCRVDDVRLAGADQPPSEAQAAFAAYWPGQMVRRAWDWRRSIARATKQNGADKPTPTGELARSTCHNGGRFAKSRTAHRELEERPGWPVIQAS